MGLSENRVYSQWNSHLIGIMIINQWVYGYTIFRHTHVKSREIVKFLVFECCRTRCINFSGSPLRRAWTRHVGWFGSRDVDNVPEILGIRQGQGEIWPRKMGDLSIFFFRSEVIYLGKMVIWWVFLAPNFHKYKYKVHLTWLSCLNKAGQLGFMVDISLAFFS